MNKLSAIVIAKDEELMIADCLDSLSFCDQVIVIDGGSKDRTVDIAKRMNSDVFIFESNDFSSSRNFGLEKAKEDWILYIDADERVSAELKDEIIELVKDSDRYNRLNSYFVVRKNFYLGNNEWPHKEKMLRVFKKSSLKRWRGKLHETPVVEGESGELDGFLLHYTHRSLSEMLNKTIKWSKVEAELRYKARHPKVTWWRFIRVMLTAFFDSYILQKGWKAGVAGLIESIYQLFSMFITYARLWEMQQRLKD